jgi:hypothetical protein
VSREPLAVAGAIVAVLQTLLTVVVGMGWWDLTAEQVALWVGLIGVSGTAAVVVVTRGKVTPVADPRGAEGERLVSLREVPAPPLTPPQKGDIMYDPPREAGE